MADGKTTMHGTGTPHYKRIEREGVILGFASGLTDGNWIAVDADAMPLGRGLTFHSANKVRAWFASRPSLTEGE